MKLSQRTASRTITGAEVESWFGTSSKSRLDRKQYCGIAAYLTKIRWPSGPDNVLDPQPAKVETEPDKYWDFAAFDAAKLLHKSLPAILSHWAGLLWAPETHGGYPAIKALQDALVIALPYIEWPFGQYERQTGHKTPKNWHLPAVMIAKVLIKEMIAAGHHDPGITRNSVVVRVVNEALIRMGYPHVEMITASAIGAHLSRWDGKYGLTPKRILPLTTK